MLWTWDADKDLSNQRKHGLGFSTAQLVFDDPLAQGPDRHPDGARWQTVGIIGTVVVFVVHTWPDFNPEDGDEVGRIISARKVTPHERQVYEDGGF